MVSNPVYDVAPPPNPLSPPLSFPLCSGLDLLPSNLIRSCLSAPFSTLGASKFSRYP